MDQIEPEGLGRTIQSLTDKCWDIEAYLWEFQKDNGEGTDLIQGLLTEVKALRQVLSSFRNCLRKIFPSRKDAEEYAEIWQASKGSTDYCQKHLDILKALLERAHSNSENNTVRALWIRMHNTELEKHRAQAQLHKLNLNLCFFMLLVTVCSDLAVREDSAVDIRQAQLPKVIQKLDRAISRMNEYSNNYQIHENVAISRHQYFLKETAEKVMTVASQVVAAATSYSSAASIRDFSNLSLHGKALSCEEKFEIEKWVNELQHLEDVDDEGEIDSIEVDEPIERRPIENRPIEHRPRSQLPETALGGIQIQVENRNQGSGSGSTTDFSHDTDKLDADGVDTIKRRLIHQLISRGKELFKDGDHAQAAEHFRRALNRADELEKRDPRTYKSLNLTDSRSILAGLLIKNRDLDEAENHLKNLLQESQPSEKNRLFICEAHYQLAELYRLRRNYEDAEAHCSQAINARTRIHGGEHAKTNEALQLLALIYHGKGSHVEAEAVISMLPAHLVEETQQKVKQQARTNFEPKPLPKNTEQKDKQPRYNKRVSRRVGSVDSTLPTPSYPGTTNSSGWGTTFTSSSTGQSPDTIRRTTSVAAKKSTIEIELAENGYPGDFNANEALAWAITSGRVDIVNSLLEGFRVPKKKGVFTTKKQSDYVIKQASPDGSSKDKTKPLLRAISHNQVLIVKLLLDRGARLTIEDETKQTPLHMAARIGDTETIRLLLDKRLPIQTNKWSAWHEAARQGHVEVLKLFLERGAQIDAQDGTGDTALKICAALGHEQSCRLLLSSAAGVDVVTKDGWTPLLASVKSGQCGITALLMQYRASLDLANDRQQTPLTIAAHEGRKEEVKMLLAAGANKETTDDRGYSPLITASRNGYLEIVQMLLENGANVLAHCRQKSTALDHAIQFKRTEVEVLLRRYGCKNGSGLTEPHINVISDVFKGYGGF